MASKQETLIYIEKENITEAEFMSRSFVNKEVKNRAYINALGAELLTKYLASEGVDVSDLHNLHSISKILEKNDISDILLPNIHIDVRVIFDDNQIFVPKSHFELGLTPDIYAVLKIDADFKYVEFLGYFKPSQIDKDNQNDEYYFFSKNKLSAPESLTRFIKNFPGKNPRKLTEEEFFHGRELSISLADHNITLDEEIELYELLLSSAQLRDSVLEFDNFETLAYSVAPEFAKSSNSGDATLTVLQAEEDDEASTDATNDEISVEGTSDDEMMLDESFFDEEDAEEPQNEGQESESESENGEPETEEESIPEPIEEDVTQSFDIGENLEDLTTEPLVEEPLVETENVELDENSETEPVVEHEEVVQSDSIDKVEVENIEPLDEPALDFGNADLGDDLLDDGFGEDEQDAEPKPQEDAPVVEDVKEDSIAEVEKPKAIEDKKAVEEHDFVVEPPKPVANMDSLSVDELLDETIAAIDKTPTEDKKEEPKKDITKDLTQVVSDAVQSGIEKAVAGAAAAGAIAAEAGAATTTAGAAASTEAIKLAAVAGEMVNNVVAQNLEKQQKNLDRIDYAKTDIAPDTTEIPEHIAAMGDLSTAKIEANMEAEASGQFETPTDLSNLHTVEQKSEEKFEQETVDISKMESVQTEEFHENSDEIVELSNLKNIDSSAKTGEAPAEISHEEEFKGMDLPNLSSFTINEDGTSSIDGFAQDLSLGEDVKNGDEHLVDMGMKMNLNEISLDDNDSLDLGMDMDLDLPQENLSNLNDDIFNSEENKTVEDKATSEDSKPQDEEELPQEDLLKLDDSLGLDDDITLDEDVPEITDSLVEESSEIQDSVSVEKANIETPQIEEEKEENAVSADLSPQNEEKNSEELTLEDLELLTDDETESEQNEEGATGEGLNLDDVDFLSEETEVPTENKEQSIKSDEELNFGDLDSVETQEVSEETNQELQKDSQDWMDDTNYDNLEDAQIEEPQSGDSELSEDDMNMITEPTVEEHKPFTVMENSMVISDKSFRVGEIPIDINNPEMPTMDGPESLGELYNEESKVPGGALLQNPGRLGSAANAKGKAGLGIGLGIVGTLIAFALIGAIGFGVAKMFKTPTEETPQPITDDNAPTSPDNGVAESNTLNVNPDNVVNMDNNTDALASTAKAPVAAKTTTPSKVAAQPATSAKPKQMPVNTFIEVRKLTWEVPDYISYNGAFKQYFQAVGKSLKLSLSSDLLLATDYAYSNEVRVSVTFDKDGTYKNSQIIISSGSSQIDKIVLQTVNQTLKTLKAPHSLNNDESTTAILKIYF